MKKTVISAAMLISLASIGMTANAAEIKFEGKIVAETCSLKDVDYVAVTLPDFGVADVKGVEALSGAATRFSVAVACNNEEGNAGENKTVTMALLPNANSFIGPVLLNTAPEAVAATGAGVVVFHNNKTSPIDFSTGGVITAQTDTRGNAIIQFGATYAKDGTGDVGVGEIKAVLPFVMTYQ